MRLWSVHFKYLDKFALVALWRESLLAQKVLNMKTKGYRNHPQLERFKGLYGRQLLENYLWQVWSEGQRRGYHFDSNKILPSGKTLLLVTTSVTHGQIDYERLLLEKKLKERKQCKTDKKFMMPFDDSIEPCPIFQIVDGSIERWEKTL